MNVQGKIIQNVVMMILENGKKMYQQYVLQKKILWFLNVLQANTDAPKCADVKTIEDEA